MYSRVVSIGSFPFFSSVRGTINLGALAPPSGQEQEQQAVRRRGPGDRLNSSEIHLSATPRSTNCVRPSWRPRTHTDHETVIRTSYLCSAVLMIFSAETKLLAGCNVRKQLLGRLLVFCRWPRGGAVSLERFVLGLILSSRQRVAEVEGLEERLPRQRTPGSKGGGDWRGKKERKVIYLLSQNPVHVERRPGCERASLLSQLPHQLPPREPARRRSTGDYKIRVAGAIARCIDTKTLREIII